MWAREDADAIGAKRHSVWSRVLCLDCAKKATATGAGLWCPWRLPFTGGGDVDARTRKLVGWAVAAIGGIAAAVGPLPAQLGPRRGGRGPARWGRGVGVPKSSRERK